MMPGGFDSHPLPLEELAGVAGCFRFPDNAEAPRKTRPNVDGESGELGVNR